MTPSKPSLAPNTIVGPFTIGRPLGAGGFGEVYEAIDESSGARRALKIFHEARLGDLQRELDRVLSIQEHQRAVARVVDRGAHGRRPWFAMELLEGQTLEERAAARPLRWSEAAPIFDTIARVLIEAHDKEIIHRDIKPSNVFLARDAGAEPRVVVLDFGVAAVAARAPRTESVVMSRGYSPIEQIEGRPAAPTMDVYAFAATLLFALTGLPPFDERFAPSAVELARERKLSAIIARRNGDRSIQLDPWFERALARDARDRFDDMRSAMRALLGEHTAPGTAPTKPAETSALSAVEDVPANRFYRSYDLQRAREQKSPREPAPHQREAIDKLSRWFDANSKDAGAIIVLPTGGGKTFTAIRYLCTGPLSHGYKVLWLAHTHHLLEQAADAFGVPGDKDTEVGWIGGEREQLRVRVVSGTTGHSKVQHIEKRDDVLICTLQAMANAVNEKQRNVSDFVDSARGKLVVVFDEAHHAPAPSYARLIEALRERVPSMRTIGLTATPTSDNEQRDAWMRKIFPQGLLYQVSPQRLMAAGVLAQPEIQEFSTGRSIEVDEATERTLLRRHGDLPEDVVTKLATDQKRNDFIVQTYLDQRAKFGRTIVFADRWFQCEYIARKLSDAGVRTGVVYSHVEIANADAATLRRRTRDENAKAIESFRRKEIDVLVNVRMLTEGTDVPSTETVFLTRQTTSSILLTQMVGRALRGPAFGGTAKATIVSFIDDWQSLIQWAELSQIGVIDALPQERAKRETRPLRLVSIELVRRLVDMMQRAQTATAPFRSYLPIGWYATRFTAQTVDDDIESQQPLVMVYEDERTSFAGMIEELQRDKRLRSTFEAPHLEFAQTQERLGALRTKHFAGELTHPGATLEDDLLRIARHVAQNHGQPPTFFPFEMREQHNLDAIVAQSLEQGWSPLDTDTRLYELWSDSARMWRVLVPTFELFVDQFHRQQRRRIVALRTRNDPAAFRPVATPVATPELQPEVAVSPAVHASVIERDRRQCLACGCSNRRALQVDHIVSQFHGGDHSIDNLQTLCKTCNRLKSIHAASYRHSTTRLPEAPRLVLDGMLPEKDIEMGTELFEQCVRRIVNSYYQCSAVEDVTILKRGRQLREWTITLRPGNDPTWLAPHLATILQRIRSWQESHRYKYLVRRLALRDHQTSAPRMANHNEGEGLEPARRLVVGNEYLLYWPELADLPNEPLEVVVLAYDSRTKLAQVSSAEYEADNVPPEKLYKLRAQ